MLIFVLNYHIWTDAYKTLKLYYLEIFEFKLEIYIKWQEKAFLVSSSLWLCMIMLIVIHSKWKLCDLNSMSSSN